MSKTRTTSGKEEKATVKSLPLALGVVALTTVAIIIIPAFRNFGEFFASIVHPVSITPMVAPVVTETFTPTITPTFTNTSTPTVTPTFTLTFTPTITPTFTPTWTPTIDTGLETPVPPGFKVGPWRVERLECVVHILGVQIAGGTPSYTIKFVQDRQENVRISTINGWAIFREPVVIKKDKPVNVSITYILDGQEILWKTTLRYPLEFPNPKCK
jgi:hypothetical protein